MNQKLVIQESFFNSVIENIEIIKEKGFANADLFFQGIIKKLNDEFSFLEIAGYRFLSQKKAKNIANMVHSLRAPICLMRK